MNDLQSLLGDSTLQTLSDEFQSAIIVSIVMTAIFVVAYIMSQIRKRKVQNAIFGIQKDLHEMNERQKNAQTTAPVTQQSVSPPTETHN